QGIREVARRVGAAPSSVKRWKDAVEEGGTEALKSKPHTGRPARLSTAQRQHLIRVLKQGPKASKIKADRWTCRHVGTVIRRLFRVRYHPDHVSRILRTLDWQDRRARKSSGKAKRSRKNRRK
ncbi:MAG: helix-turn-helix domain-containing protein, partial [Nitrospirales bacterium]|nr:helix-turn-helix domain-containing protein [Nitrospirales bacterium]